MSVLFPAPEGPMMADSSPERNFPVIDLSIVLYPVLKKKKKKNEKNE